MTTLTVRTEDLKKAANNDLFKNGCNQNFAEIDNSGMAFLYGNTPYQFTQLTHPFATGDEGDESSDNPEHAQYLAQLKKTACILNYVATVSLAAMDNDYSYFSHFPGEADPLDPWDPGYSVMNDPKLWGSDFGTTNWSVTSELSSPWGTMLSSFGGGEFPPTPDPAFTQENHSSFDFNLAILNIQSPTQLWTDTVGTITGAAPDAVPADSNFSQTAADITLPTDDPSTLTLALKPTVQPAANAPLYIPPFDMTA